MATSTFVRYWSDDSEGMPELKEAYQKLESDFLKRKEHLHPKAASAMHRRLENLRHAWALMLEPVPKSYGG